MLTEALMPHNYLINRVFKNLPVLLRMLPFVCESLGEV